MQAFCSILKKWYICHTAFKKCKYHGSRGERVKLTESSSSDKVKLLLLEPGWNISLTLCSLVFSFLILLSCVIKLSLVDLRSVKHLLNCSVWNLSYYSTSWLFLARVWFLTYSLRMLAPFSLSFSLSRPISLYISFYFSVFSLLNSYFSSYTCLMRDSSL